SGYPSANKLVPRVGSYKKHPGRSYYVLSESRGPGNGAGTEPRPHRASSVSALAAHTSLFLLFFEFLHYSPFAFRPLGMEHKQRGSVGLLNRTSLVPFSPDDTADRFISPVNSSLKEFLEWLSLSTQIGSTNSGLSAWIA